MHYLWFRYTQVLSTRVAFLKREENFLQASTFVGRLTRDLQTATRVTRDFHHNELVPLDEAETSLFDSLINAGQQSRGGQSGWPRGRNKRGISADGTEGNSLPRAQSRAMSRPATPPRPYQMNGFARRNRVQQLLQTEDTLPATVEHDFVYYTEDEEQMLQQQRSLSDEDELFGKVVYEGDDEQVAATVAALGDERGEYFSADRLAALSAGNSTTALAPGASIVDSTRSPVRRGRDDRGVGDGRSELLSERLAARNAFGSNKLETRAVDQAAAVQINSASSLISSLELFALTVICIFILALWGEIILPATLIGSPSNSSHLLSNF